MFYVIAIVYLFLACCAFGMAYRVARNQTKCKHDQGVEETRACDAVCRKCGKNLGFIGAWREKQKEQQ